MTACPTGNTSLGLCDTLTEVGIGVGNFAEETRLPLGKFIMFLALIGAVIALIVGIIFVIKHSIAKHLE